MYLHICKNNIIKTENIIGIFDINTIKETREFKNMYLKLKEENQIINISENIEKSFILVKENKKNKAYISNISVNTLEKRTE